MAYNAKRAIADLGFIEAYSRIGNVPGDDIWFEHFLDAFDQIEAYIKKGCLLSGATSPEDASTFLYNVGYIRGSLWNDKIPYEVSQSLHNLVSFVTEHHVLCLETPEPRETMLSDSQRDALGTEAMSGSDIYNPDFMQRVGVTSAAVVRYTCEELGIADYQEAEQWADESRQNWEAEQAVVTESLGQSETLKLPEVSPEPAVDNVKPYMPLSTDKKSAWEEWQVTKLVEMKQQGATNYEVAAAIGKKASACHFKWLWERKKLAIPEPLPTIFDPEPEPVEGPGPVDDAVRRFLEKGGKIKKLPPRKAEGVVH